MSGDGTLTFTVWPTFVGAVDRYGGEPADDYERGQITWHTNAANQIYGQAQILVPAGFYVDLCYFYDPRSPLMVGHQHLEHPFDFKIPGVITVDHITKEDFTQQRTPHGFRLPLVGVHR